MQTEVADGKKEKDAKKGEIDAWADQGLAAGCFATVLWLSTMDGGVEKYYVPIRIMVTPVPFLLLGVFLARRPDPASYSFAESLKKALVGAVSSHSLRPCQRLRHGIQLTGWRPCVSRSCFCRSCRFTALRTRMN